MLVIIRINGVIECDTVLTVNLHFSDFRTAANLLNNILSKIITDTDYLKHNDHDNDLKINESFRMKENTRLTNVLFVYKLHTSDFGSFLLQAA